MSNYQRVPCPDGSRPTTWRSEDYDLALKSFAKAQESGAPVAPAKPMGPMGLGGITMNWPSIYGTSYFDPFWSILWWWLMVKNGELGTVLTGTWLDYDFPIHLGMECHHPNWRTQLTPSFFRGVGQPPTSEQLVKWVNSTENSPEPSNAGQVAGRHAGEQTGGGSARPWHPWGHTQNAKVMVATT